MKNSVMRNAGLGLLVLLVLGIGIWATWVLPAPAAADTYDYPVKPGTDAWAALKSHADMIAACQIPESTLSTMSTAGLVETVLNYPLLGDMRAFNSVQQGFDSVSLQFNGIQELFKREAAGEKLLTVYFAMDPSSIENYKSAEQIADYQWRLHSVQALLAQDAIQQKLTLSESKDLVTAVISNYLEEQKNKSFFQSSLESSAWLIGKSLIHVRYPSFTQEVADDSNLQNFLSKGSLSNDQIKLTIISQAEAFLLEK